MKKYNEIAYKVPNHYIKDNYMQCMLAYRRYLLLFGNKEIKYFKNLKEKEL